MKALDQAFIKAYLQQAAGATCRPEESEKLASFQPEDSLPAGLEDQQGANSTEARSLEERSGEKCRYDYPPPSIPRNSQKTQTSSCLPASVEKQPTALTSEKPHLQAKDTPTSSSRKSPPTSIRLGLAELLSPEDPPMVLGLPPRRIVQALGAGQASQATSPPRAAKPHFLSGTQPEAPSVAEGSPVRGLERTDRNKDSVSAGSEDSEPECILEFPTSTKQVAPGKGSQREKARLEKVGKNPTKIRLQDLEIPKEVCFFEPPSPTIPLGGSRGSRSVRGRPEFARPKPPSCLNLFDPEGASGLTAQGLGLQKAPESDSECGSSEPKEDFLEEGDCGRLRLHQPSEPSSCPQQEDGYSEGDQASVGSEASSSSPLPPAGFSPRWRVERLDWPGVCLALQSKASTALDRVAEAILSAYEGKKKIFGFISLHGGDGATTLLLCTARQLSQRGYRVVLVDADPGDPDLADRLNLAPQAVWEQVAEGGRSLEEVMIECSVDRLVLLPRSGSASSEASQQAWLARRTQDINHLRSWYEIILVDLGRLDYYAEALRAKEAEDLLPVEGLLIVRNLRRDSSVADLTYWRGLLQAIGIPVIGIVDNCV